MFSTVATGPGGEPTMGGPDPTQNDGQRAGADPRRDEPHPRAGKAEVPNEEECLRAIAQTGRLMALGMLKPSVGNAVRGAFRDILRYHQSKAKEAEKIAAGADVLDALR